MHELKALYLSSLQDFPPSSHQHSDAAQYSEDQKKVHNSEQSEGRFSCSLKRGEEAQLKSLGQ